MNRIADWIASHEAELTDIAHDIFCHPELAYEEIYSSKRLAAFLENQGFQITWKTAGIDTAFTAIWGMALLASAFWQSMTPSRKSTMPAGITFLAQAYALLPVL